MASSVAVLGGGIAGMTAAHELVERGFKVTVYEKRAIPGGKARSLGMPGSGDGRHKPLPGEHGFRFFPGFYRHIPDTMRRIPYDGKTVYDNLVVTTETQIARAGKSELFIPAHFPASADDLFQLFEFFYTPDLGLTPEDLRTFTERLLVLLTTCKARRFREYEYEDWWHFSLADKQSPAYGQYCADGITRTCVACKAKEMSARTGGYILLQLLFGLAQPGAQVDRLLNGPTNDVWIDPWLTHLRTLGVDYHLEAGVTRIHCQGDRITGVVIEEKGREHEVTADYYISALPAEIIRSLLTPEMLHAEPALAQLHKLKTCWMNGIQFYLAKDVPLVHGHTLYMDSPWSLTSISQQQFWPSVDLAKYGDGRVRGILSVDISDWETADANYPRAVDCQSREEIEKHVWHQLQDHLNDLGQPVLEDQDLVCTFLDEDIVLPNPGKITNLEPLLVNTRGSWDWRPKARTRIANFFLAGDYVRTYTDLATMEGANESARRAVNALLHAAGSKARKCKVWRLREPWIFAPLRWYDYYRWKKKLPHDTNLIRLALTFFVPMWYMGQLGWELFRGAQDLWRKFWKKK
jgi:uncharacterized protein with NAD-binding domain and iron-sulfur cluster